jgi:Spy/CpxP family protein refolding chaperone
MKLNKSSILALMTLGGLMAFGPLASADDTKPVPPPDAPSTPPPADAPAPGPRGGGRGPNMEKILDQLNLSADQKEKVKPVLKDQMEQMKAMNQDSSLTAADKRSKRREIREATNTKLKEIFTADQYTQWEKLTARGGRRRNAGAPPADAPSTPPPPSSDSK